MCPYTAQDASYWVVPSARHRTQQSLASASPTTPASPPDVAALPTPSTSTLAPHAKLVCTDWIWSCIEEGVVQPWEEWLFKNPLALADLVESEAPSWVVSALDPGASLDATKIEPKDRHYVYSFVIYYESNLRKGRSKSSQIKRDFYKLVRTRAGAVN